jgi:hypothetical protein
MTETINEQNVRKENDARITASKVAADAANTAAKAAADVKEKKEEAK